MQEVSAQAEAAEPLLSKELYDSLRKNSQAGTDQTLKRAEMLAGRGLHFAGEQLRTESARGDRGAEDRRGTRRGVGAWR